MEPTRRPTAFDDSEFDDPLFETRFGHVPPTSEERVASVLAHLSGLVGVGVIAPLVIYLLKKDASPYVAHHAREALNFHLTVLLALVASAVLSIVLIGIPMLIVVALGALVLSIVAALAANDGTEYRYPFTLRLVT